MIFIPGVCNQVEDTRVYQESVISTFPKIIVQMSFPRKCNKGSY